MTLLRLHDLIGKKIYAVKSNEGEKCACRRPNYILLNDGETIIDLEEQDEYEYHDCCSSARIINIYADKERWQRINLNFSDANYGFY